MAGNSHDAGTVVLFSDVTANPAPLGLLGFGLTTVLLNLHNAGFFAMGSMILGMGIFYGGLAQVIAGIMEWKRNNMFGMVAFTSYGMFWLSLVGLLVLPRLGLADAPSNVAMAAYLGMWGIFTAVMFIGTLRMTRALQIVFGSLAILFFLLALGEITGNRAITTLAGYEGVICGLSAVCTGLAEVLGGVFSKTIAPAGSAGIPRVIAPLTADEQVNESIR